MLYLLSRRGYNALDLCVRIPSMCGREALKIFTISLSLAFFSAGPQASAQVHRESFSHPVGLDPQGDNWVALRTLPSGTEGTRVARLGPDTLFTELGRQGAWVRVRLLSGEVGWIFGRYVGCCRTAVNTAPALDSSSDETSCENLWRQRNLIFKTAGYCFRTSRGIAAFGNAGCQFDDEADVPLSVRQRSRVDELRAAERRLGCTP